MRAQKTATKRKHRATNPEPFVPVHDKLFVTAVQLRHRYGGRSEMWLSRILENDKSFPRPITIGRFRFWDLTQIEAFERQAAAKRETTR
jgi:predicted DNA-binding transcriptional regulator AlpA